MILHEIQPQDTNDYFLQAKILKEHGKAESEKLADHRPVENLCTEMRGKSNAVLVIKSRYSLQSRDFTWVIKIGSSLLRIIFHFFSKSVRS